MDLYGVLKINGIKLDIPSMNDLITHTWNSGVCSGATGLMNAFTKMQTFNDDLYTHTWNSGICKNVTGIMNAFTKLQTFNDRLSTNDTSHSFSTNYRIFTENFYMCLPYHGIYDYMINIAYFTFTSYSINSAFMWLGNSLAISSTLTINMGLMHLAQSRIISKNTFYSSGRMIFNYNASPLGYNHMHIYNNSFSSLRVVSFSPDNALWVVISNTFNGIGASLSIYMFINPIQNFANNSLISSCQVNIRVSVDSATSAIPTYFSMISGNTFNSGVQRLNFTIVNTQFTSNNHWTLYASKVRALMTEINNKLSTSMINCASATA